MLNEIGMIFPSSLLRTSKLAWVFEPQRPRIPDGNLLRGSWLLKAPAQGSTLERENRMSKNAESYIDIETWFI